MAKFLFKCVTKDAVLGCTLCPGGQTNFVPPVPNQNIIKEQSRELAVKEDITILPFTLPCMMGTTPPPPCSPTLGEWRVIDQNFLIDNKIILLEKSLNKCVKTGIIFVMDKKQNIISVDLAEIITRAIKALECMIDYRLDQFTNDKPAFDSAFDYYFGTGHTDAEKQIIVDRMKETKNLTNQMINADGTLNENHFEPDLDTSEYSTFAYVYPGDKSHVVHICPYFFSDTVNISGTDSKAGTLAHETSHFSDVGGTTDEDSYGNNVYGSTDSRALAISDPSQALMHADSFEYFIESGSPC
jgi:hypothetical protein